MYPYVQIGNQLWLVENLDYKFDINGSQIPIGVEGVPSTPAAWYYNNDESTYGVNGNKYGLLYNWYAAKYLDNNKLTLLPKDWHVPSASEYTTLLNTLGSNTGTKLKSTTDWRSGNGDGSTGFNAYPAGIYDGIFYDKSNFSFFWTITEVSNVSNARAMYLDSSPTATINSGSQKYHGFSIRLVRTIS